MKRQLLFAAALLAGVLGMKAQNIIAAWDGGTPSKGKPDTFGWKSSLSDRTWGEENASSGIRFTTKYSDDNNTKYKLENGSEYKYVANSEPSSKILWIRYNNNKPETYTYTFKGLEAGQTYVFSGLVGWHNNEKDVKFTIKIKGNQGTKEYATMQVEPAEKRVLYAVSEKFTIPEDDASTEFSLEFTGTYTYANYDDCMEALSALAIYSEQELTKKELDEAKKELYDVLNTFNTKANVGTGAFQIPVGATADIDKVIADATIIYNNEGATVAEVRKATTDLQTAKNNFYNDVEINGPAEGVLYNVINVSADYLFKDKAITFKSAFGAEVKNNNISMEWTEAAGSIYPQGILFEAVNDEVNTYKLSYTRADNTKIYIATGKSVGTHSTAEYLRATTNEDLALKVKVAASIEKENVWYLYNTECIGDKNNQGGAMRIGGNGNDANNKGLFTGEFNTYQYYDMLIAPAAEYTAEVEIAGGKYSTIIVPFDVAEIGADVYSVSEDDVEGNVLKLQPVEGGIKANTPYIVYAEKQIDNLSGIGAAYTDKSTFTEGLLTGTYATNQTVPAKRYVLQTNDENEQGFYVVNDGNFSHTQYRAYLTYEAPVTGGGDEDGHGIKAFYFNFADGDATAIEAVPEVAEGTKVFYNLAGQRVANPTKGIYIVNGQKVLVK